MIKLNFTTANVLFDERGQYKIVIDADKSHNLNDLQSMFKSDKPKVAEIKYYRKKRSLDANAALWLLLDGMAKRLLTTKEELYEQYIKRYGVSKVIGISPDALDTLKQHEVAKYITIKDRRVIGDKKVLYVELHFGSSTYDSAEMAYLIDMVLVDAKELGVDLISDSERDLMIKEWDK